MVATYNFGSVYKVEGSGCGFNRNRGLAETDS